MLKLHRLLKNKGVAPVVVVLLVAAAVVATVIVIAALGGFGFGNGQGDGEGDGNMSQAAEPEVTTEEELPVIEELEYLDVSVSGTEYLYQNSRLTLDELVGKLKNDAEDTQVKVKDEDASKKAYESLINALKENGIKYIEDVIQ